MSAITHVGRVIVPVADQDAALAFYVEQLGCEVRFDAQLPGGERWLEVAPRGAETAIALVSHAMAPAGVEISFTTDAAAADHAALEAAGAGELLVTEWAPPMFTFRDPEGHRLRAVGREDASS